MVAVVFMMTKVAAANAPRNDDAHEPVDADADEELLEVADVARSPSFPNFIGGRPNVVTTVARSWQDKKKDKPYLLPLRGGQLYCHGRTRSQKKENSEKGAKIFKARKLRNARQIHDLARPEKIWPRSQKPKKN